MLRYLWLPSYRNIQAQGFTFDPALTAHYATETGVLTLADLPAAKLPAGFYGKNIELVTGVLGENGAGKSALVSAILDTAGSFANDAAHDSPPCLFVFESTIVHQASVTLSNRRQLERDGYRVYSFEDSISYNQLLSDSRRRQQQHRDPITQHCYIHYANFMDSPWIYQFGVIDVSTAYMLNNINARNQTLRDDKVDSLMNYQTQNFKWEVNALHYLFSRQENPLPFAPPRLLQIEALPLEQLSQAQLDTEFFRGLESEALEGWHRLLMNQLAEADKLPSLDQFLVRFALPRLLVLLRTYPHGFKELSSEQLRRLLRLRGTAPVTYDKELDKQLAAIYRFTSFVRDSAAQVQTISASERYGRKITRTITLDIHELPLQELLRVFAGLTDTPNLVQTFEASWSGLSSGQIAYLRLYARLYHALRRVEAKISDDGYNIETLTILLDEAETAFHPQWQKNYLHLLLGIVSKLFASYRVQLIACSNSPFIASDIPQSNLLLLHRQPDGSCEVKPWGGREKTFAANIHTLLTESFFMADGLMGDFAREKVGQLIAFLQTDSNQSGQLYERREEMHKLLDMIGEPVLRMKLREMWTEKFGTAERIADLERQLAELRRQQENG